MGSRFQDFQKLKPEINLLSHPFSADIDSSPEDVQLELIDMQSNNTLQQKFNFVPLQNYYQSLCAEKFPSIKKHAAKMMSIFGTTYVCEQSFSCMKIAKRKHRSSLTDFNMQALMKITTSNFTPDFKKIVKDCERLHSSHKVSSNE